MTLSASAQMPDFTVVTDVRAGIHYSSRDSRGRFYDPFARMSTVSLNLILEGFYVVHVSERFARIPGDSMGKQLESAYFEFPGVWRLGFIDAKFGRNWLIREYALGAEFRTYLLFDNLPIVIATLDDGLRRTRGVISRLGGKLGVSFATGDHFGASGTSLTSIRRPEDAPGIGRGYKLLLGVDAGTTLGDWKFAIEGVSLRNGQTSLDLDEDVIDAQVSYQRTSTDPEFRVGYARALNARSNHIRAEIEYPLDQKMNLTGQVRFDRGQRLFALGLHLRF